MLELMFSSEEKYVGGRKIIFTMFSLFFIGIVIVLMSFVLSGMGGTTTGEACEKEGVGGLNTNGLCEGE